MFKKISIAFSIFLFGISNIVNAQFSFTNEIGIITGPVFFQSDYGQRHDFNTNLNNSGFGIGIIHHLNFSNNSDSFLRDHFKWRNELSLNNTNFKNYVTWDKENPSIGKTQVESMYGQTVITNIGVQLEFFPWSIHDFTYRETVWAPFISLGTQFSLYNAQASSKLGTLGTPLTTFPKYLTPSDGRPYGFSSERKTTWSAVTSFGTRYKISDLSDLMVDLRFQYYASDWVDGLNINKDLYTENKANDWNVWLNFGYIYYIQ